MVVKIIPGITVNYILSRPDLYGEPHVIIDSESMEAIGMALEEGVGVSILPEPWAEKYVHNAPERLISIPFSDRVSIFCGWGRNCQKTLSFPAEAFINMLKECCR
jgi:DNA-binding transcriptional LysR family regulator